VVNEPEIGLSNGLGEIMFREPRRLVAGFINVVGQPPLGEGTKKKTKRLTKTRVRVAYHHP
jgi:hypothetical protein